jgi:hypothetical protein
MTNHPDFIAVSTGYNPNHELSARQNDGFTVSLNWNQITDEISVHVSSAKTGEDFTIQEIPHPLALDVFHHPYAYASRLLTAGTFAGISA